MGLGGWVGWVRVVSDGGFRKVVLVREVGDESGEGRGRRGEGITGSGGLMR